MGSDERGSQSPHFEIPSNGFATGGRECFHDDQSDSPDEGGPTTNTGKTPPTGPLTRGERRAAMIAAGVLVGVIAVGAAVWALVDHSGFGQSDDRCVTVTMASSMGGGIERACGKAALDWCHVAYGEQDAHAQAVQVQCQGAGIPS